MKKAITNLFNWVKKNRRYLGYLGCCAGIGTLAAEIADLMHSQGVEEGIEDTADASVAYVRENLDKIADMYGYSLQPKSEENSESEEES